MYNVHEVLNISIQSVKLISVNVHDTSWIVTRGKTVFSHFNKIIS